MNAHSFHVPSQVVYGAGKASSLDAIVLELSSTGNVVLISDKALVGLGVVAQVEASLSENGLNTFVYDDVESNPTFANIDGAAALIRQTNSDVVIGVGGGSPLDVAKTASLVAGDVFGAEHYALMANPFPAKTVKTIAIPTTAGTGAEVTSTTIYSDTAHRKLWAWDQAMVPELAVLDPNLTTKLPPFLTAATGLDAMIHAFEAITGQATNPFIEAQGLHAIRLVAENLPQVLADPEDIEARGHLLIASTLAGIAIEHGGTGLAHNLGHALSTVGRLHHGRAVAVGLYHTYEWNLESDRVVIFAKIARALGVVGTFESEKELALAGASTYRQLVLDSPIELDLTADGLTSEDMNHLTTTCLAEENQPMRENNCRYASDGEIRHFTKQLLTI